ncbi:class I SAM-dependent methyltransferase [Longimicrobium terrae]|uniref:SAM-dependent methyltransferase n=1 Tax=Longimicrobium terrae TaxID=1639882 RepID=A0A841H3F1_9BACT|nr:class I SAM-dependent methyltransferase [Longimicrobium terrae]MBB4638432.1 SAM-dependent methyltransferase [Longimicrobium terrae]MBB6072725.1 SAM-dependent methyltransferase [Longimicrobium terrae]NNC32401.1 methyltransferase domain-containing protein [Longimicrobium terrae]
MAPSSPEQVPLPPSARPGGPSMLDLVRLSRDVVFPPGGEDLYRQIGRLTELTADTEVLDVACGRGTTGLFLAESFGVSGVGVDHDPVLVQQAERRGRESRAAGRFTFETASLDDLPFKDASFDVVIGEIGLAALADPARAVAELARVTRPYGCVVLVQLIWTGNVDPNRREILVRHLGARPMILVEWKQLLRDAGVVELVVEDWSDSPSPFRPSGAGPFPDFSEIFTLRERLAILRRAYRRWGWGGVKGAVIREREVHRLLTRERVLGLSMIKGTRWPTDRTAP